MKHPILCTALVFGVISAAFMAPAGAADLAIHPRTAASGAFRVLPFPRSERAQAVWASDACWRDCGAHTAWALAGCLRHDAQGECLQVADGGDRTCQLACRTRGGPYLPIE
jgi:hypothetical protein